MDWGKGICPGPYYFGGGDHKRAMVLVVQVGSCWGRAASLSRMGGGCAQTASPDMVCVKVLARDVRGLCTEESGMALVYCLEVACASVFGNIGFPNFSDFQYLATAPHLLERKASQGSFL